MRTGAQVTRKRYSTARAPA